MPRVDQRGSSALLYLVAVVMIGGFMYWLYMQTQSMQTDVQPTMQDTAATQQGSPALTLDSLAGDTEGAIGSRAALDSVEIATGLGRGVFLVQLDSLRSLPVLKNPTLIQRGNQLYGGDVVTVAGQVYTYTDSIGQTWVQRGAVSQAQAGSLPTDSVIGAFLLADSLVMH